MELHQPLLPLSANPPTDAPSSEPPISAAVATPLEFSSGLREATRRMKADMPTTGAYSLYQAGPVPPRVMRSSRGVWLAAASGHRLRHRPGAVSQTSGSDGMARRHHSRKPVPGSVTRVTQSAIAAAIVVTRPTCHTHMGVRRRIWV